MRMKLSKPRFGLKRKPKVSKRGLKKAVNRNVNKWR